MKILKIVGIIIGSLIALCVIAVVVMNATANGQIAKKYDLPAIASIQHLADSSATARGQHLATAVSGCVGCHGEDLGGLVFVADGPLGVAAGPNLTRGRGGVGSSFTETDWIRAIRYGIRADSTSLLIMPSETFAHLTDRDLAALIAYLEQLPPVDREVPRTKLALLGKLLMLAGALPVAAEHTTQPDRREIAPAVSEEYGRYLAEVAGCKGCHGPQLAGGIVAGPPGTPPSANLTPAGPIAAWSEADFFAAMREGKRPDGSAISEAMPWRALARMTDDELRAILMYLRSVPAVQPAS